MRSATRKVADATSLWCRYPSEIEADFERFYPRLNLADWHRGTVDNLGCLMLSSRKLLTLIYRLPESSEFKTHAPQPFGRGGNWTEFQQILAHIANETSADRASKYAGTEHEYEYTVFLDPVERRERAEEAEAEFDFQENEFDKLVSIFGM